MKSQMPFEQVWNRLCHELALPRVVRNWTVDSDYIGRGDFTAQMSGNHIVCVLTSHSEIQVPKKDFETVYEMWSGYLSREIPRYRIRDVTRHSKYIISVFHQFLESSDE